MKARIEVLKLSDKKVLRVVNEKNQTTDIFDIFEQNFTTAVKRLLQLEGIRTDKKDM